MKDTQTALARIAGQASWLNDDNIDVLRTKLGRIGDIARIPINTTQQTPAQLAQLAEAIAHTIPCRCGDTSLCPACSFDEEAVEMIIATAFAKMHEELKRVRKQNVALLAALHGIANNTTDEWILNRALAAIALARPSTA